MKRSIAIAATAGAVLFGPIGASQGQQVVGSTQLGVAVAELRNVTVGWSAKRQILGQSIYNDKGEAIGKADDIIIAPDKRSPTPSSAPADSWVSASMTSPSPSAS